MALNDKVNLQVKAAASAGNYIQYAFKFTSYENKVVNLNNYRIVCYFNTFREAPIFIQERILSGYPTGTTSGGLSNVAGFTNKEFFTETNPPRIYPITKRYDKETILPLTGTAACLSAGSYFDNIVFQIRFSSGQSFISENIGSADYEIGIGAFSKSYSVESSTSYVDNSTFILEYNDPTYGWIKVQEYVSALLTDTNTGLYPYDEIYEQQKAVGNINRQYGWDTTYDHDGILASYDGYVFEQQPNSAYPAGTTYTLNGSGAGSPDTRVALFKFSTTSLTDKIVSAAEFYTYFSDSNQNVLLDCRTNNNDYTSGSTWNSIGGWSGTSGVLQSQLNINDSFQLKNSYLAFNLDKNVVQNWQASSANNLGINLRYNSPSNKTGYNSPTIVALENTSYDYLPIIFVYSGPISAAGERYIRWEGDESPYWSVPGNWEGGIVPTAADYAVFDQNYSSASCILDSNQSVKNVLGTSALYTGSINLSSNALTIYSTTSALNINYQYFNNIQASASTLNVLGNIVCSLDGNILGTVNFSNGCQLSGNMTANVVNLGDNKSIANYPLTQNIISITTSGRFNMGNGSSIDGYTGINFREYATINELGTLNGLNGVLYTGSSIVCSRTYNCGVAIMLLGEYSYTPHDINATVTFTSGNFVCNGVFSIYDTIYTDTWMTIDMATNNPTFRFNDRFEMYNTQYVRPGVNIIFPSSTIELYGNVTFSALLSGTTNASNCTFNMINPSIIRLDGNISIPYTVGLPRIFKLDNSLMQFYAGNTTSGFSFQDIVVSGNGKVSFNGDVIKAIDSIYIDGDDSTVYSLDGSLLSADNINFIGKNASLINLTSNNSWSAYATSQLNADYVLLGNSIATSSTGYAIRSTNLGGNVNWYFDTIPPIITETSAIPGHFAQSQITASFSIYDEGGFDSSTIAVTNGFGTLTNLTTISPNSATFDVVISGTQRCGMIELSARDFSGNITEFTSLPFSYDYTAPNISILSYSPPTGVSNSFIDLLVSANDNCILSGSHQIFSATFNGQPTLIQNLNIIDESNATATIRLSSSSPITNGDLYISATDASQNTSTLYSSAFSIATIASQINFVTDPYFKIGSTHINVSAIFEDVIGMSQVIPYTMLYNGLNIPFSTIYVNSNKTVLSAVIPSNLGSGYITVGGYNTAGVYSSANDLGYDFIPVIIFGDPVPSNISKTTIIVPISAVGSFIEDADYYYARINNVRMPITTPTSGLLNIFGYNFEYLSFSATVSSVSDLYGDLILSAGYN
jgi:hypothetical protein